MNGRAVHRAAKQLLARDHVMARIEEQAREDLVLEVCEAQGEIFARVAGARHRISPRETPRKNAKGRRDHFFVADRSTCDTGVGYEARTETRSRPSDGAGVRTNIEPASRTCTSRH